MTIIKRIGAVLGLMLTLMLGVATPAQSATLPTCTPGLNCLQFGDFNVYSLPLLDLQAGGDGVPSPGDQFFYSSTYGAIKNYTIVGINNGNCTTTGNPTGSADCSYDTPSAGNSANNVFSTKDADAGGTKDPGPNPYFTSEFAGDTQNTWDIQTGALTQLIGGANKPVVAFFAFNEDGSANDGTALNGPALLTWVQVTLRNTGTGAATSFYLCSGPLCQGTEADTSNLPAASSNETQVAPWAYVHSGVCTVGTAFVGFPNAAGSCSAFPGATLRNQNNLGQNAAAFMVNSPGLDAALATGNYDVMQVLWKMAYISGGGETAWIQSLDAPTQVSEPSTLATFALALVALGFAMRRRSR